MMLNLQNETHAGNKAANCFLRGRQLDDVNVMNYRCVMQIRVPHKHIVTILLPL